MAFNRRPSPIQLCQHNVRLFPTLRITNPTTHTPTNGSSFTVHPRIPHGSLTAYYAADNHRSKCLDALLVAGGEIHRRQTTTRQISHLLPPSTERGVSNTRSHRHYLHAYPVRPLTSVGLDPIRRPRALRATRKHRPLLRREQPSLCERFRKRKESFFR